MNDQISGLNRTQIRNAVQGIKVKKRFVKNRAAEEYRIRRKTTAQNIGTGPTHFSLVSPPRNSKYACAHHSVTTS